MEKGKLGGQEGTSSVVVVGGGDGFSESPDNQQVWFHKRTEWSWLSAQLFPPPPSTLENTATCSLTWEHMWESRFWAQCQDNVQSGAAPNAKTQ